jgi:methyl-accepting chemotaxis protein
VLDFLNAKAALWEATINDMNEKGFDTAEMQEVLEKAKAEAIEPLTEAFNSGNAEEMIKTRREIHAKHLHSPANFRIAQVNSVLSEFREDLINAGFEEEVKQIDELLETAGNLAVPGHKYENNELQTVWDSIKEARQLLRQIITEMNNSVSGVNQ